MSVDKFLTVNFQIFLFYFLVFSCTVVSKNDPFVFLNGATTSKSAFHSINLFLVKCYDNKMAKSPYNLIIHPLIKPQVANQQQQQKNITTQEY